MITKQEIQRQFSHIRNSVNKAKTKEALNYLSKECERMRKNFIVVYLPNTEYGHLKNCLLKEHFLTIKSIKSMARKLK